MDKLEALKAKADQLLDADFVWYSSPFSNGLAVGINWDIQEIVLVDVDHPDGAVIQTGGLLDIDTVYVEEAN